MNARRLLIPVAALILFAIPAQADPITYRIDFTTLTGVGTVDDMIFTYDPTTELFSSFLMVWHATYEMGFIFGSCIICHGADPNSWSSLGKQNFLDTLRVGGVWGAFDTTRGLVRGFNLGGYVVWMNGVGHNTGDTASGTFKTTGPAAPVPEPGTLTLLSIALGIGLVWFRR